jgi:SAM-dependent methyltransferase
VRPVEAGTLEVLTFLRRVLPAPPLRVLEVGCGRGELAALLLAQGYAVTALDVDPVAVAAAREAGVPAMQCDFLDSGVEPHDAVLFTRSLHHVADLERAAALAADACVSGGVVVVDEFARERADAATAAWFYDVRAILAAAGALAAPEPPEEADPKERWEIEYGSRRAHRLHTGEAMVAALRAHLDVELAESCPYLYRQLAQWLEPTEHRGALALRLLQVERERLARGELVPLGVRAVARRRATP